MTIQTLRTPGRVFDSLVGVALVMISLTVAGATAVLGF